MEPVRWGILSTARINHAVLEPARETDKAEVIAVASRDADRAQSYAREHGIERAYGSLMEAFMYRHHPQTHELKDIVQSGAIGELRQVRAAFSFMQDEPTNVRLRPELDGGSLMDLGCYCVGITRLLAGEPELVFGRQRVGQLENLSAAIRGDAEPLLGRADALQQARTIGALYRSAETGAPVRLETHACG